MSKKKSDDAIKSTQAKTSADVTGKATQNASGNHGLMSKILAFKEYLILSRAELRKVSWPSWKETRTTSLVVLGFVAVMAILLGVVDLILSSAVRMILS